METWTEVWVEHSGGEGPTICAQVAEGKGWLMFLRYLGDAGFSSRNPAYQGAATMRRFSLANGQVDMYPESWCLPVAVVVDALVQFVETGEKPSAPVAWRGESGGQPLEPL